ncbi:DUF1552 domain-containing protein [Saccharospirillum alexandrii]|uniref:DUF1552 domain-containing protein n=1 Tax=Saccharospirillum alexandrii TaxID=2448477 RepID=UPI000FDAF4A0|nr:DUF1552 domain-containing protein [Saccharospirillum alexandrii]
MKPAQQFAMLKRREFLKTVGKAGLSIPLLRATGLGTGMMLSRQAMAEGMAPRRVMFVYIPDGTPGNGSQTYTPDAALTLKECSAPLESVKDECVFLNNMFVHGGGGHGVTQRVLGAFADGVSGTIDLALGDSVGALSPVSSLRLGVFTGGKDPVSSRGWSAATDLVDNPASAFEKLFSGSIDTSDIGTQRALVRQAANDQALRDLIGKLDYYERQKLEQHRDAIAKLKSDVESASNSDAPLGCSNPIFNPSGASTELNDKNFTNVFNLQVDNAILAMKCDLTRVVTLQLGTHQADFSVSDLSGEYHGAIHGNVDHYKRFRAYFSERMAHLIQRLKDEDDPAGGRMIDSTLVVQVTDMGDGGSHTDEHAPFMLAGGGSAINRGTLVDAGGKTHHHLLDVVADYMGVYGTIGAYSNDPVSGILT